MDKKNNNGFLIGQTIIIILLIIVIVLLVIGGNKKDSATNNNEKNISNNESSTKSEEIALDDTRFYSIYDKLKGYTYTKNRSDGWQSFSDQELLTVISAELKESDFTKTEEKIEIDWGYSSTIYTLNNDVVINHLKQYFDNNVKIDGLKLIGSAFGYATKVNFDGGSGMVIVSYEDNKYKVRFSGIGGASGPAPKINQRKIISAFLENDEITIKEKAIYLDYPQSNTEPITYTVYSDVDKKNKIDSKEYTNDNINDGVITVEDYLDKASTITTKFAYDSENDRYYFKSSVIE